MPRLKEIKPETATGKVKELFDGPLAGKHFNIFKAMANSPAALEFYLGAGGALSNASLTPAQRELIALAISEKTGCEYCVAAHTAIGKGAGLSEDVTVQARQGGVPGDAKADAIVKFVLALHEKQGWVTDEDIADFRAAGFNDGHIAEVVATYAQTIFTNFFNHVNHSEVDFPAAPALAGV